MASSFSEKKERKNKMRKIKTKIKRRLRNRKKLKSVNNNDFFDVITKDSPIYLEENGSTGTSLSATAGGANDFKVIVSYEEIV